MMIDTTAHLMNCGFKTVYGYNLTRTPLDERFAVSEKGTTRFRFPLGFVLFDQASFCL